MNEEHKTEYDRGDVIEKKIGKITFVGDPEEGLDNNVYRDCKIDFGEEKWELKIWNEAPKQTVKQGQTYEIRDANVIDYGIAQIDTPEQMIEVKGRIQRLRGEIPTISLCLLSVLTILAVGNALRCS